MKSTSKVIDYVIHFKRTNQENGTIVVDYKAPQDQQDQDKIIFEFCFPVAIVGNQKERREIFSFVLTDIDAKRKYGYCLRRVHATESDCFCLITQKFVHFHCSHQKLR